MANSPVRKFKCPICGFTSFCSANKHDPLRLVRLFCGHEFDEWFLYLRPWQQKEDIESGRVMITNPNDKGKEQ